MAATGRRPYRNRVPSGLAWWTATWLILRWHLGMVETEDGRALPLGPADACTLFRAWLVPLAAEPRPAVHALALASDVVDGPLARRRGTTRFGRDLEGIVDAAFAAAALRGLARRGAIGRPLVAVEAVRQAAGAIYTAGRYFGAARPPDRGRLHAGRVAAPIRGAGLIAAAAQRRRAAQALLCAAAVTSAAAIVRPTAGASWTLT
jgi:phosphatidylglycerophosphate synthase